MNSSHYRDSNIRESLNEIENDPQLLQILLTDSNRSANILWNTSDYEVFGSQFAAGNEITPDTVSAIHPRIRKTQDTQLVRTKERAEVFTPSWLCNLQINAIDNIWFQTDNAFNKQSQKRWIVNPNPIEFPDRKDRDWRAYIKTPRVEITCGEAPYLASRYDVTTGNPIPIQERIGIFDRKMRIVNESTTNEQEWIAWSLYALQATYGFELSGDSLFIARLNLLTSYFEYLQDKQKRKPYRNELHNAATIIAQNLWQSNPLAENIPTMFASAVGNPPFHKTNTNTSATSIYSQFMNIAYESAPAVCLVTPARFLFNAGKTSKEWNSKLLKDPDLLLVDYFEDSSEIFTKVSIKGGVAVTLRERNSGAGPIGAFPRKIELADLVKRIQGAEFESLASIIFAPESYKLSQQLHLDKPNIQHRLSKGHQNDITTNIFQKLPDVFRDNPIPKAKCVKFHGRTDSKRTTRWVEARYIRHHDNLDFYKLIIPKANGSGRWGEPLSSPIVLGPGEAHTQTYISIGMFKTKKEAEALQKYLQTKFARALLSTKKVTQDNKRNTWLNVPLLPFAENPEIDWQLSISDIDKLLYSKYHLTPKEIQFIETSVESI